MTMSRKIVKHIALLLSFLFLCDQAVFAQLDLSASFRHLSNSLPQEKCRPSHLRYLAYDNFANNFQLLLDKGDFKIPEMQELKSEIRKLVDYFFIGITLPNNAFWVNLRPDSPDMMIDPLLEKTDLGKVFLEADLQLKRDTAKYTSPQTPEGRQYWDKLYKKAEGLYGTSTVTIPTLTRPWIVPDEIIIRETADNAYIYKASLKVMLEQDYLKDSNVYAFKDERAKSLNEYSAALIRELILPRLTKEVNTAKRYAPLRQVYYSLIFAQWFKQRFSGRSGMYSHLIDRKNLYGLTSRTAWDKDTYFTAYRQSFQEGEYNIKQPVNTPSGQEIRSYMSGGMNFSHVLEDAVSNSLVLQASRQRTEFPVEKLRNGCPEIDRIIVVGSHAIEEPYAYTLLNVESQDREGGALDPQAATDSPTEGSSRSSSPISTRLRDAVKGFLSAFRASRQKEGQEKETAPVEIGKPAEVIPEKDFDIELKELDKYTRPGITEALASMPYTPGWINERIAGYWRAKDINEILSLNGAFTEFVDSLEDTIRPALARTSTTLRTIIGYAGTLKPDEAYRRAFEMQARQRYPSLDHAMDYDIGRSLWARLGPHEGSRINREAVVEIAFTGTVFLEEGKSAEIVGKINDFLKNNLTNVQVSVKKDQLASYIYDVVMHAYGIDGVIFGSPGKDSMICVKNPSPEVLSDFEVITERPSASSALEQKEEPIPSDFGGIDMRSLPQYTRLEKISVTERPPGRIPSAVAPELSSEEAEDQDAQWREIEKMAISGIQASPERIREYLLSVKNLDRQTDTVIAGFAIILRTQENGAIKTESGLKDILTLLETGSSGEEIQFALRQIVFESKNPQK